jgi:hypothetical protein
MVRACLCIAIIVAGLALRRYGFGLGLPAFIVKYGGSVLWAMMVFFLVALAGSALSRPAVALISAMIALGVELFRLVHAPWLDAFRLTMAGALLLGRIFSLGNLVAYGAGIVLAVGLDYFSSPHPGEKDGMKASLVQLKPLKPMQLLLDAAFQVLTRAPWR